MSVSKIAARYAKPLMELALEQNKLDTVYQDIVGFRKALKNKDLSLLFKSPIVNPGKKQTILKQLFENKMDKTTFSFLDIVVKKGREDILDDITQEFVTQYKAYKNITTVHLTTARQFSGAELDAVKSKIQSAFLKNQTVEIISTVDPRIIGGFVVNINDKEYDASVQHKLDELKKTFSSNVYQKAV